MEEDAVSPVVGTILLTAIAVVMAGVVFLLVSQGSDVEEPPRVAFQQENAGPGGRLTVAAVDGLVGAMDWSRVSIVDSSTASCTLPTGTLRSGDIVTCSSEGSLVLSYRLPSGDTVLIFDGRVR